MSSAPSPNRYNNTLHQVGKQNGTCWPEEQAREMLLTVSLAVSRDTSCSSSGRREGSSSSSSKLPEFRPERTLLQWSMRPASSSVTWCRCPPYLSKLLFILYLCLLFLSNKIHFPFLPFHLLIKWFLFKAITLRNTDGFH